MVKDTEVNMMHGAGGEVMGELLQTLTAFKNNNAGGIGLESLDDGSTFTVGDKTVVLTTDSHVVKPLFFPGGDIGRIAVSGTINDLSVMGARPIALTCAMVIEEGFPIADLEKIVASMDEALGEVGAAIITGDTKVVEKGSIDGIAINTAGVGVVENYLIRDKNLQVGDKIIVSGNLGDHGMAIVSYREGFDLGDQLKSDVAPLWKMIEGAILAGGEDGVKLTLLDENEEVFSCTLVPEVLQKQAVYAEMLEGDIGYIKITNFEADTADNALKALETLRDEGSVGIIFDVRHNPGGYASELVKVLDYLLPEGDLFHSVDYSGKKDTDTSDAKCLQMPMAVLINKNSYSAAEFFAAALEEYNWATVVGDPTSGKGNFQYTFDLPDGSGVGLSVGKYYTPNGVSLAEQGGLVPEVLVEISDELAAKIYADLVPPAEDPQIQAAVKVLTEGAK